MYANMKPGLLNRKEDNDECSLPVKRPPDHDKITLTEHLERVKEILKSETDAHRLVSYKETILNKVRKENKKLKAEVTWLKHLIECPVCQTGERCQKGARLCVCT